MKKTLAENLLRFAPKNLDAATIEKLQQIVEQTTGTTTLTPINIAKEFQSDTPIVVSSLPNGYFGLGTIKGEIVWFPNGKIVTFGSGLYHLIAGVSGLYDAGSSTFTKKSDLSIYCVGVGKPIAAAQQVAKGIETGTGSGKMPDVTNMKAQVYYSKPLNVNTDPAYVAATITMVMQKYMGYEQISWKQLLSTSTDCIDKLNSIGLVKPYDDTMLDLYKDYVVKLGGKLV